MIVDSEEEAEVSEKCSGTLEKKQKSKTSRQYRKRKSDSEPSDEETSFDSAVKHGLLSNTPPDKNIVEDNRIEKTSSEDKSIKPDSSENVDVDLGSSKNDNKDEIKDVVSDKDKSEDINDIQNNENIEKEEKKQPKRSIWEKRTVGELYDAAVQRFYERRANRLTASGN